MGGGGVNPNWKYINKTELDGKLNPTDQSFQDRYIDRNSGTFSQGWVSKAVYDDRVQNSVANNVLVETRKTELEINKYTKTADIPKNWFPKINVSRSDDPIPKYSSKNNQDMWIPKYLTSEKILKPKTGATIQSNGTYADSDLIEVQNTGRKYYSVQEVDNEANYIKVSKVG